jgi:succinate-semialdehyde dehydrogenase/glutarate-semialdehyde dehydrogenase
MLALGQILLDAGLPAGVLNVITASDAAGVMEPIIKDGRARKLSFTGSTEVGRGLLALAAESVVNCSMELGGNAPFVVFADADLDAAIDGAMIAKMRNAGEACTAANRFYVHADVAEEFSRRLAERMSAMTVGPGTHDDTQVGPLVNEESAAKVDELVRGAVSAGARVVIGGERPDREGFYYSPTVLLDVPRGADILGEEIFGPVAPVLTFTDEDEVIRRANATRFGLAAGVFTRDLARGHRVAHRLEAGICWINNYNVTPIEMPFGGTKESGIGHENGQAAIEHYTQLKSVFVELGPVQCPYE